MGLETGTWVEDLVVTNPPGGDDKRQGDDHLRLIKTVLKNTIKRGSKAFYLPTVSTKVANYAVVEADENTTFSVDTSAGAVTLTLPTTAILGWRVRVVKSNSGINPIYLVPSSGLINGYSKVRRTIPSAVTEVEWTGSWVASRPNGGAPVGSTITYYGATLPNGHLWADGAGFTAADYVELNTVLGSALTPDVRERTQFGRDNLGTVTRLTAAGAGVNGDTLLATGGAETVTLTAAQLAAHNHTVSSTGLLTVGVESVTHSHAAGTLAGNTEGVSGANPSLNHLHGTPWVAALSGGSGGGTLVQISGSTSTSSSVDSGFDLNHGHAISSLTGSTGTESANHTHAISGTTQNSTGGGGAHPNLPPAIICNVIVVAE